MVRRELNNSATKFCSPVLSELPNFIFRPPLNPGLPAARRFRRTPPGDSAGL
jgi:hypothetical protein